MAEQFSSSVLCLGCFTSKSVDHYNNNCLSRQLNFTSIMAEEISSQTLGSFLIEENLYNG